MLVPLGALGSRLCAKIAYPPESADDVEAQTSGGTCSIGEAGWQERARSDDGWIGRTRWGSSDVEHRSGAFCAWPTASPATEVLRTT